MPAEHEQQTPAHATNAPNRQDGLGTARRLLNRHGWWFALLAIILAYRLPLTFSDSEKSGKQVGKPVLLSHTGQVLDLNRSPWTGRQVLLLWATWCKPCKLQLSLIKGAVGIGLLAPGAIIAVNTGEEPATVDAFVSEHDFPVTYAIANDEWVSKALDLQITPTMIFMRDLREIDGFSSGLTTFGLLRAAWYLR